MRSLVWVIFAAVAFPGVFSKHMTSWRLMYAHETAALKAIQMINAAQVMYYSQNGHFGRSLAELAPLAPREKPGYQFYKFTLSASPAGSTITPVPSVFGSTGARMFFSDQSLVVRENWGPERARATESCWRLPRPNPSPAHSG